MNHLATTRLTTALDELGALLGDRLSTVRAVRERHGKDETYHPGAPPDAVAFAHSTAEVSRIVEICARQTEDRPAGNMPWHRRHSSRTNPRRAASSA